MHYFLKNTNLFNTENMKQWPSYFAKLFVLVAILAFWGGHSVLAQNTKLVILHTNDMHSKLTGYGPESDYSPLELNNDKTIGGFARLATVIKQTRAANPNNMLLLDDGDFLMGSIFHAAEPQTAFQLQLMHKLGYDYVGFGNHEFDYGPGALAQIISVAQNAGKLPKMVSSNMVFSDTSAADNTLESLFKNGAIKPYYTTELQGIKIGIFSTMGIDAASVAPGSKPVSFANPFATAKAMVKLLREVEKVDYVICLSHGGIYEDTKKGGWIFEDVDMAKKVNGLDLIVSGHTHVTTNQPYKVKNTYIVQAGAYAQKIGYLELEFSNKKLSKLSGYMINLDDKIEADKETHQEIEDYKKLITEKYLSSVGLTYDKPLVETSFPLVCNNIGQSAESNLGPLMADALHYYINKFASEGTDITMVASGTIREDLIIGNTGIQTAPDIFRVASLGSSSDAMPGYPLSTIYINGKELKGMAEVLLMAQSSPDSYIYYSGIKIYYNPSKMMLRKVKKIEVGGKEVNFDDEKTLYKVSANVYLLSFVGRIKSLSKGLITVVPKLANGNPLVNNKDAVIDFDKNTPGTQEYKEWLAIVKYLQSFEDTNGNGIPDIPEKYRQAGSFYVKLK